MGRLAELLVLLTVLPTLGALVLPSYLLFPAIWTLGLCCWLLLRRDREFDRGVLWNIDAMGGAWRGVAARLLLTSAASAALLSVVEPERLLAFPRERPETWAVVMIGYPLLSVYPQELAFRAYAQHRLSRFGQGMARGMAAWVVSGTIFGYAHVVMQNWIAVGVSAIGGVMFARTYEKHRSLAVVSIEHALHGCSLFTIGWGWYFYMGAVR